MSLKSFLISASGLRNIVFSSGIDELISILSPDMNNQENLSDEEFLFFFGEYGIKMNRFFADFISPRASSLHKSDPTINTLFLNDITKSKIKINTEILEKLKSITIGETVNLTFDDCQKLKLISYYLGNDKLFNEINQLFSFTEDEMNIDDCILYLQNFDDYQFSINYDQVIKYVSSHFYLIDTEKLLEIPRSILYSILQDKNLKLKSEDSLFDFIENFFSNKKDDFSDKILFYELINFSALSESKLIEYLDQINPTEITVEFWNSLKKWIFTTTKNYVKIKKETENERYFINENDKKITISYDNDINNQFNGIITYLGQGTPEKVVRDEIVDITSSSINVFGTNYLPMNAVYFNNFEKAVFTSDIPNSWLMYDFKDRKVKPSHYSIRSHKLTWSSLCKYHLQSWCIEGSNNKENWTVLDSRKDDRSLVGKSYANTFEIESGKESNDFFRYLRIRQTNVNSDGKYWLILSALEFFGTIKQ